MNSLNNTLQRTLRRLGNAASLTDEELLGHFVAAQDQAAFAELVRRHGPMVWRVCRRVLHQGQDAEDAFQATFIVLARKAASVSQLANWLYGVAQRVASKARTGVIRRRSREMPSRATALDLHAEQGLRVETHWEQMLDEELSRLPNKYRAPLVLCYLEGKSNAEAAGLLHCGIKAVESRLVRGRRMLHGRLTRRGVTPTLAVLSALLAQQTTAAAFLPERLLLSAVQAGLATRHAGARIAAQALAAAVVGDMGRARLLRTAVVVMLAIIGLGTALAAGNRSGTLARQGATVPAGSGSAAARQIGAYDVQFVGMTSAGLAQWSSTLVYGVPGGGVASGTFGAVFPRSPTTGNYPTLQQAYAYFQWDAWYQTNYFRYLNPASAAYSANPNPTTLAALTVAFQKYNDYMSRQPLPCCE